MLLFQIFLIRSMLWKILHLLVCFELRSCDFLVKSNFGPLTICLILVLYYVNSISPSVSKNVYAELESLLIFLQNGLSLQSRG